jgi:hypothetical protein
VNTSKDGQGWNLYWANRLALAESNPLFGYAYDLVGIWYTFEAKDVFDDQEVCFCLTPFAYRPVVAELRLVKLNSTTYTGAIWVTRNSVPTQIGSANVIFGATNTSATINWSATFKNETIPAVSDSVSLLLGSDPNSFNNDSHYTGIWQHPTDSNYSIDDNLGSIAQVINLTFYVSAGDPVWIQALNTSSDSSDTDFCFSYLSSGYAPNENSLPSWSQVWDDSGCDSGSIPGASNHNAGRFFTDFDTERFWTSTVSFSVVPISVRSVYLRQAAWST